jgi:mutator protein MutT
MPERLKALVAVHLLLVRNNQILIARRANTGYHDGDYSVAAGHVDMGESSTQAMIREAKEEIGITIQPEDLEFSTIMHRYGDDKSERIDFFFSCEVWTGTESICEPHKCDDLKWVDIGQLPENTISYIREGIDCYKRGVKFMEFGWEQKL